MRCLPFIVFIILGVSLSSCYEKQEGCLDQLATNFSIEADNSCDDCCTYPTIGFQLFHFLGETKYHPDSTIINDFGQKMQLKRSLVFLSDFKFFKEDNGVLEVNAEGLYADLDENDINLKEDHVLIDQNDNFISIGSVRENGTIDSLSCNVGIHHNYIALEEDALLYTSDSLYAGNQYYDMVFYLEIGDMLDEDISVRIRNVLSNKIDAESVTSIEKIQRSNLGLVMFIDYLEILKKINIEGISDSEVIEELEVSDRFIKFQE